MTPELSDQDLKDYAAWLIYDHARDVEFISIYETAGSFFDSDVELTDEQARRVDEYISSADITVIVE